MDPLTYGTGLGGAIIIAVIFVVAATIDTIITHKRKGKDK